MAIAEVLVEGRLPGCYIDEITKRKNRFMGAWTGTSGSLAANCHWLLVERSQILEELQAMQDTLQEANAKLRQAVETRVGGGCCEGGKCHPTSIDTQGPLLDPDQVIAEDDERTAESPFEAVSVMSQSQMEAAWAGVKSRVQSRQRRVQEPVAAAEKPTEANEAERLLADAIATIRDRRAKYGPPLEHFLRTVGAINAIFAHKLRDPLTPEDWAQIMMLDKLARHQEQSQRDNPLDGCGYAACWGEIMALQARSAGP